MSVTVREWGCLPTGERILMACLTDASGLEVRIMNYGATVTSIRCRDRAGIVDEVVLGFDSFLDYLTSDLQAQWPYLGSTIGRYANRIAGASFVIDGTRYALSANDGPNHLHGGSRGFDRAVWTMHPIVGANGVSLSLVSPDGEQGYPGRLDVHLDILLEDLGELVFRYSARTDRPTHVNLTSHCYFNLGGSSRSSVADHELQISASRVIQVDGAGLPTGAPIDVAGSGLDLRKTSVLADTLAHTDSQIAASKGVNHCYALDRPDIDHVAVVLWHPPTGRQLCLCTTAPGLQVYTANQFDGTVRGRHGHPWSRHCAVALEPQYFPDSPNRCDFPTTLLRPGDWFRAETRMCFGTRTQPSFS
jgi:aldose 1-epimerase